MNNKTLKTIEDCLEVITAIGPQSGVFDIEPTDETIMISIARQTNRGIALTDKQHILIQEKLNMYKSQFIRNAYTNFDVAIMELRKPLREVDRSKYIKISYDELSDLRHLGGFGDNPPYIKIRFPFKKSLMSSLYKITKTESFYGGDNHSRYFAFKESTVEKIMDEFGQKGFEVDQEILDVYKKIKEVREQRKEYVCAITDNKVVNMHKRARETCEKEIGEFNDTTRLQYIDRHRRYGILDFERKETTNLTEAIAYREDTEYHSKPSKEPIEQLLDSVWTLNRFPLLVVLEESQAEKQLHSMLSYFRDILPVEQQSVLFRLDGGNSFNDLVKDRGVNNWVDENTKIVYISASKLPKLLLKNTWRPNATLAFSSKLNRSLNIYIENSSDLIIFREEVISLMRRHSSYYG